MGKETKIGLVVVGVLAGALLGVVVKKFLLPRPAPTVEAELFAQPAPQAEKPKVVLTQQEPGAEGSAAARDNAWAHGEATAGMPHGSFLPADSAPADGGIAPLPTAPEESVAEAETPRAAAPQQLEVAGGTGGAGSESAAARQAAQSVAPAECRGAAERSPRRRQFAAAGSQPA